MVDPKKPIIDFRRPSFDSGQSIKSTSAAQTNAVKPSRLVEAQATQTKEDQPQPPVEVQQNGGGSGSESSNTPTTSTATKSTAAYKQLATSVPDEFKGSTNQALIDFLERKIKENEPLTKEQVEKLRRRQRAEGIISGISDVAQSVANLIATHHYAPNMYNPKEGMSARAKERFDKEKAEREAEDDRWYNNVMNLARLKAADRQQGLQVWTAEQNLIQKGNQEARANEAQPYELSKKQAEAERERKLSAKAGYEAEAARVKSANAQGYAEAEQRVLDARAAQANAAAVNSRASAAAHGRSNPVRHFLGKSYAQESDDYKKDVWRAAREYNARHPKSEIKLQEEDPGSYGKSKMRDKDPADIAAEVEYRIAQERAVSKYKRGDKKPPLE